MKRIAVSILIVVAILAAVWGAGQASDPLLRLAAGFRDAGPAAPLLFAVVYVVAVIALVPGSILTIAAGAMFGVVGGVIVVFIAATIGSSIAFLVARHVVRPAVERRLRRDRRLSRVAGAVGRQGFRIVFLLRLTPVVPFSLLNYALGVTPIRFRDYLLASIGMLPGTVLYVYSGRVAGELTAVAAGVAVERHAGWYVSMAVGLLATALLVMMLTRMAREALREETGIETLSEQGGSPEPGGA